MVEAILKAQTSFPESESLQLRASQAIHNLLIPYGDNFKRFTKAKGIEALLAAMTTFPANVKIQRRGCRIMCRCVMSLKNQDENIDLDALNVVGQAIKNHRDNEQIVECAQKTFKALTKRD
jgi:hypothetical protein